ncbi:MAG TPA: hypothetical protein VFJ43_14590 [Bacteroidia bacterium]|nr:hypothetical protein [Bacteroidia bacterium]
MKIALIILLFFSCLNYSVHSKVKGKQLHIVSFGDVRPGQYKIAGQLDYFPENDSVSLRTGLKSKERGFYVDFNFKIDSKNDTSIIWHDINWGYLRQWVATWNDSTKVLRFKCDEPCYYYFQMKEPLTDFFK